jgi:hypothetical protein
MRNYKLTGVAENYLYSFRGEYAKTFELIKTC